MTAVESPAAMPVEARPPETAFVVERRLDGRWLAVAAVYSTPDRRVAEARLDALKALHPEWEHRLVERTTTYRVVPS